MKKMYEVIKAKRFRPWIKILSFCLFSFLLYLLLSQSDDTARKLGLYGLVIWMGNYSFELARWIKGSGKN